MLPIQSSNSDLLNKSVFFAVSESSLNDSSRLLELLSKQRLASFIAFKLKVEARFPYLEQIEIFITSSTQFLSLPIEERRKIVDFYIFRIWFKQVASLFPLLTSLEKDEKVKIYIEPLNDFSRIAELALRQTKSSLYVPDTSIQLSRYNVDKWIRTSSPPTFTFPSSLIQSQWEKESNYPLDFFGEVLQNVLLRIKATCPTLFIDIQKFVWQIIHLDREESFRSCSADRYVGTLFLTGCEDSLFQIEESILHEYAHQVLYNVMELNPLILNDQREYTLPWSGSKRGFYGYFHALYIYILLASYFVRIQGRDKNEMRIIKERTDYILKGIKISFDDFDKTDSFNETGHKFYRNLKALANNTEILFARLS